MNEFTTVFLITAIGDYQTHVVSCTIIIGSIPVVCFFFFLLLNLHIPKQPSFINGKVYIGNTSLPTINFLRASITIIVLGPVIFMAMVILYTDAQHGDVFPLVLGDSQYAELRKMYNSHQYLVTEGTVHVLHTQPSYGHDQGDIVRIGDIELEVDYYGGSGFCYQQTISHGGVLTEGTYARVFYVENPPNYRAKYTILRVDIKKK